MSKDISLRRGQVQIVFSDWGSRPGASRAGPRAKGEDLS